MGMNEPRAWRAWPVSSHSNLQPRTINRFIELPYLIVLTLIISYVFLDSGLGLPETDSGSPANLTRWEIISTILLMFSREMFSPVRNSRRKKMPFIFDESYFTFPSQYFPFLWIVIIIHPAGLRSSSKATGFNEPQERKRKNPFHPWILSFLPEPASRLTITSILFLFLQNDSRKHHHPDTAYHPSDSGSRNVGPRRNTRLSPQAVQS